MAKNQVISEIKEAARWIYGAVRPRGEFLDRSAFSFPSSRDEADTRFARNLTRFRSNYAIVLTILLALTMIARPFAVLAYLASALALCFLSSFPRDGPFTTVIILCYLTIPLRRTGVSLGVVVLLLHALWRGKDDLVAVDLK